jgi:hypothetical protein
MLAAFCLQKVGGMLPPFFRDNCHKCLGAHENCCNSPWPEESQKAGGDFFDYNRRIVVIVMLLLLQRILQKSWFLRERTIAF